MYTIPSESDVTFFKASENFENYASSFMFDISKLSSSPITNLLIIYRSHLKNHLFLKYEKKKLEIYMLYPTINIILTIKIIFSINSHEVSLMKEKKSSIVMVNILLQIHQEQEKDELKQENLISILPKYLLPFYHMDKLKSRL